MKKAYIRLSTIQDIRRFIEIVTRYDTDIDLTSGRYTVDAKSIMGIFSLNLMDKIGLIAHTENADKLFEDLKDFMVKD